MKKKMLIIITRMYAEKGKNDDEFVSLFRQDSNQDHAVFPPDATSQTEQVVVVIHGYHGRFGDPEDDPKGTTNSIIQAIENAIQQSINLESINLADFSIGILFHPHPGWMIFTQEFPKIIKQQWRNIAFVQLYSGSDVKSYQKIQELANKLKNSGTFKEEFEEVWDFFAEKPSIEMLGAIRRLSILKHRIAHLFLPIDIDLQGLMETGFRENYWKEVVEAWKATEPGKPSKAYETLHQARTLLYDQGQEDSVAKVVKDAKDSAIDDAKRGEIIENAWRRVQSLLPKGGSLPDQEVEQILHDLGCQNRRESVQQKCQGGTNPFHNWFVQLIEALDELRDAIENRRGRNKKKKE